MSRSLRQRIAGERTRAGAIALVAALPPLAAAAGLVYIGCRAILDAEDLAAEGGYFWLAVIAAFVGLFLIVARWTFDAVRAALTPQRIQAMWLRRFHSERDGAFRTSRVIDRLSRYGISPLTLQDSDVQLSFEQRRNRLAPVFWLLFIPVALLIAWAMWNGWQVQKAEIMDLEPARDLRSGIGQAIGAIFALVVVALVFVAGFFVAILATVLAVMSIAALAGPIGAAFNRNRDDFRRLPALLRQFNRGKRRGAVVLRISDDRWRAAVSAALAAADVAIVDLSDVSDHVAWEIAEAAKTCGASSLVFVRRDGMNLTNEARAAVRTALGREPEHIVVYPARRNGDTQTFARALREQIYAAADARAAGRG